MSIITPYNSPEKKKEQIKKMFNNISGKYDFLNYTLSLGMDQLWRKKAIKKLNNKPNNILDIATGTGDFAITAAKHTKASIIGIDISEGMLDVGMKKINKKKLNHRIKLQQADSEDLPFKKETFDAITVGFGVRNFENIDKGISEMHRVLKKNGSIAILEPSSPVKFPLKELHSLYFQHILPTIGSWISKDKKAYKYLPESVNAFPNGEKFIELLKKKGFQKCRHIPLSLGIVSLYIAIK